MGLAYQVENLDKVDESLRGLYEQSGDVYKLKVEGLEDTGALKRAKDHEKQARKDAETKARELQEQYEALKLQLDDKANDDLKRKGDIEALEKSWKGKLEARESELTGQLSGMRDQFKKMLVDGEAARLSAELAVEGSASLLIPHIKARLSIDEKDGRYVTIVNDQDGKPSAATLDELKAEFASNPAFAPVIIGSRASGGGAAGGQNGGGAPSGSDLAKMSRSEKLKYFQTKR